MRISADNLHPMAPLGIHAKNKMTNKSPKSNSITEIKVECWHLEIRKKSKENQKKKMKLDGSVTGIVDATREYSI